jgi:hypothetical protein
MRELDRDLLASVIGAGESSTQITLGLMSHRSTTTDYRTCVDAMKDATRRQYPDTRPWYHFGFGTDQNAVPRARAEVENVRSCGPPPQN